MANKLLVRKNILLIFILIVGFFLRVYNFQELFYYTHDNDLAGWVVKDIVVNRHLRLIGQETSTQGIFIGALFYYLQIPFYFLTRMDPIGGTLLTALLGTFTVWSFYFVFSKIWNKVAGFVGAFIYAFSFYTLLGDREVVPTMPVILWTVWYLYALWLLLSNKQKWAWPILGVLLGLIWHLNFALVLVTPLIPIAWLLGFRFATPSHSHTGLDPVSASNVGAGKRQIPGQARNDGNRKIVLDIKALMQGVAALFIVSVPLILFELRHNFQQTHSLIGALTTDQHDIVSGTDKVVQTFHIASKNVTNLLWGDVVNLKYEWLHWAGLLLFAYLVFKKIIGRKLGIIMAFWLLAFMTFFSSYSKVLSEYYLNGMMVIYIAIFAVSIASLLLNKKWKSIGIIIIVVFIIINLYRFFAIPVNRSGYVERKAVIAEIKRDSVARGYPCVSISYITNPGNNLGYRYFVWKADLKTKPISNEVPVYTIVFPLKPIFAEDKSFGAIGLIYPDYSTYNEDRIKIACEGADWNLEEPMFGFTQ